MTVRESVAPVRIHVSVAVVVLQSGNDGGAAARAAAPIKLPQPCKYQGLDLRRASVRESQETAEGS